MQGPSQVVGEPAERLADTAPLPALLRRAWAVYAAAVRTALDDAGFGDMPRNGSYVTSALAGHRAPLSQVIAQLGVSKQAAGQLVDTLVVRGYLERSVDPADRRRLLVALTPRGQDAADAVGMAVAQLDAALEAQIGATGVTQARAALTALTTLGTATSAPHPDEERDVDA